MDKRGINLLLSFIFLISEAYFVLSNDHGGEKTLTLDSISRELEDLKQDRILLRKLQDKHSQLASKYEILEKEMQKLSDTERQCLCNSGKERDRRMLLNDRQMNATSSQVGFHAATKQYQENMQLLQTVQFPDIITNVGGGFDAATGIFLTPATGLYFFTITILSYKGEDIETEIVVNGQSLAYAYSGSEQTWGSGTTSTTVHLSEGDKVWVRILNYAVVNNGNIHVFGGGWSSFTGFKLA